MKLSMEWAGHLGASLSHLPGGCTLSTFALELCPPWSQSAPPTPPPIPGPCLLCPRERSTLAPSYLAALYLLILTGNGP